MSGLSVTIIWLLIMVYDHPGLPVKRLLIIIIEITNLRAHIMLTTGNQLKAARMLADVEQIELAEISGVSVSTIRAMEGQGGATLRNGMATVRRVQDALEARGIEFQNHGQPGVRLMRASKGEGA